MITNTQIYELVLTYTDGTMKKEQATLPNLMYTLGIYFTDPDWLYAEITNAGTGEVIAGWSNASDYGVTSILG